MNVEGLTRENGASHLQKYMLFIKWMHGLSKEGPSFFDPFSAPASVPRVFTIQISIYYINFWGRIQRLGYKRNDRYSSSVEMFTILCGMKVEKNPSCEKKTLVAYQEE